MKKTLLRILAIVPLASACSATIDGQGPPVQQQQPTGTETPPESRSSDDIDGPEQLFEPPTPGKATPDDVFGLWSLSGVTDQTRLLIRPDSLTIARRCTNTGSSSKSTALATVNVAARIEQRSMAVLEGKEDVQDTSDGTPCTVAFVVGQVERCSAYQSTDCFHLPGTGTQLSFYSLSSGTLGSLYGTWIKVMD